MSKLTEFLRIISEENRLKIICFLRGKERCVCEIWQFLNLSQNLISHHLKTLKDGGLLRSEKRGQNVYYSLNNEEIAHLKEIFNSVIK